jgi:SnoaL-like polyketide cyclase
MSALTSRKAPERYSASSLHTIKIARAAPCLGVAPAASCVLRSSEATGTPKGELFGVKPSGRSFKTMSIDVFTVKGEKLASAYHVENWVGALQQLSK